MTPLTCSFPNLVFRSVNGGSRTGAGAPSPAPAQREKTCSSPAGPGSGGCGRAAGPWLGWASVGAKCRVKAWGGIWVLLAAVRLPIKSIFLTVEFTYAERPVLWPAYVSATLFPDGQTPTPSPALQMRRARRAARHRAFVLRVPLCPRSHRELRGAVSTGGEGCLARGPPAPGSLCREKTEWVPERLCA